MKKIFFLSKFIFWLLIISDFAKAQCVPPTTIAVGPVYIPCSANTVVVNAGTTTQPTNYSYSWTGPLTAGISCPNCCTSVVNTSGIYTVVITNTIGGCFNTNTVSVIQSTLMNVSISGNDTICNGSGQTLSALAFGIPQSLGYNWSTGGGFPSINVSPTLTTVYSVTVINVSNGCIGSNSFTVHVIPCAGIHELNLNSNVRLSPNPNNGNLVLFIENVLVTTELKIIIPLGQELVKENLREGKNEINLNGFSKGIYYYEISQDKKLINRGKIIIE